MNEQLGTRWLRFDLVRSMYRQTFVYFEHRTPLLPRVTINGNNNNNDNYGSIRRVYAID